MMARPELRIIHAVSDATGNLARHMLHALLTQFPEGKLTVKLHPFVNTPAKLEETIRRIADEPGLVVHGLVKPAAKQKIEQACRKMELPCADLTGPFARFITEATGLKPRPNVQRLHQVDEQYRRRITALDYTIEHDDGLGLTTLHEADVVLAGVSRTSKTPTSILLAQDGFKVANVPLAMQVEPPQELLAMDADRVVGLYIDASVLTQIRGRRWQASGAAASGGSSYTDPEYIERELQWSRRLFRKHGWPSLDVTDQAIEETAGKIRQILNQRQEQG